MKTWEIEQTEEHIVRQLYTVKAKTAKEAERLLSEGNHEDMWTLDMRPMHVLSTSAAREVETDVE